MSRNVKGKRSQEEKLALNLYCRKRKTYIFVHKCLKKQKKNKKKANKQTNKQTNKQRSSLPPKSKEKSLEKQNKQTQTQKQNITYSLGQSQKKTWCSSILSMEESIILVFISRCFTEPSSCTTLLFRCFDSIQLTSFKYHVSTYNQTTSALRLQLFLTVVSAMIGFWVVICKLRFSKCQP